MVRRGHNQQLFTLSLLDVVKLGACIKAVMPSKPVAGYSCDALPFVGPVVTCSPPSSPIAMTKAGGEIQRLILIITEASTHE